MQPGGAVLDARAKDDDLTTDYLTITWTKVSGPGTVTFNTPTQVNTGALLRDPVDYVLRLTASDGALSASAVVRVTAINNLASAAGWLALPDVSTVKGIVPITLVPGVTLVSGTLSYMPASNETDMRVLNPTTVGAAQIGVLDTTLITY